VATFARGTTVALAAAAAFTVTAAPAMAQSLAPSASKIDPADTAWMIVATALVLMMSIPGLALFYSGMVRKKNVLATMAQTFAATALCSVLWMAIGYTLAFTGAGPIIGTLNRVLMRGIGMETVSPLAPTIPEALFLIYQMTFAVITVALVAGSVADRMRFSAFLWFSALWLLIVYVPIAHWVWGGGFLQRAGVLDFAGGTVVHLNAGVAGLVGAYLLGPRRGYGWFGFNGGSALAANSRAVFAITATHLAASMGALTWMALEWWVRGKPSVLGMISGAVAGLGTITPASGFVLPWHGLVIGLAAGVVCFYACTWLKIACGYDDSLDVFGVHGIGGATGTLLVGVFATRSIGNVSGLLEGHAAQVLIQLYGVVVTLAWSAIASFILFKAISVFVALRVDRQSEMEGLDVTQHGEALQ
jgi:Amt family ammonium transporter